MKTEYQEEERRKQNKGRNKWGNRIKREGKEKTIKRRIKKT